MSIHFRLYVTLVSLVFSWAGASAVAGPSEVVSTQGGLVQGTTNNVTSVFLGIPYAKPPVGDLRWRDPQAAVRWSGVKQTVQMPAFCPQAAYMPTADGAPAALVANVSEDCLYLNVWKPASAKAGSNLPVMVWLYGGGDVSGGVGGDQLVSVPVDAANPSGPKKPWSRFYDGARLAERANVVVVTINFRIGILAAFPHPALEAANGAPTTNLQRMDQILALQWVKQNVSNFGGNNKNVTLFGQSAGAVATCALIASPLGKGLFQKAILQSGFCNSQPMGTLREEAVAFANTLPSGACSTRDCLLKKSALELVQQQEGLSLFNYKIGGDSYILSGGPVEDGRFLKTSMKEIFEKKLENPVTVIVGNNSAEFPVVSLPGDELTSLTDAQYLDYLIKDFGQDRGMEIYALHPTSDYVGKIPEGQSPSAYAKADTLSTTLASCPSRQAARELALGVPVYRYFFSQVLLKPMQRLICASEGICGDKPYLFGPAHGMEILWTLQHIDDFYSEVINPGLAAQGKTSTLSPSKSEKTTEGTLLTSWRSFAWNGEPSNMVPYLAGADRYNEVNGRIQTSYHLSVDTCNLYDAAVAEVYRDVYSLWVSLSFRAQKVRVTISGSLYGERRLRNVKVVGSIPIRYTSLSLFAAQDGIRITTSFYGKDGRRKNHPATRSGGEALTGGIQIRSSIQA